MHDAPPFDELGAHVSSAGGVRNAPGRAAALHASVLQLFTKMASRWAEPVLSDDDIAAYRAESDRCGIRIASAHDSYLINLASPDPVLRARSLDSFLTELRRCEALGLSYLVSHPGNYMDDRPSGVARNAEAIGVALESVPGNTLVLMETTAGSG